MARTVVWSRSGLTVGVVLLTEFDRASEEVGPGQPEQAATPAEQTMSATPPAARIDAVQDTYHGTTVADPYQLARGLGR